MPAFSYEGEGGRSLVLSALAQPRPTFGGQYLYRTIFDKGAELLYSITKNHGFINGNKRMAWATVSLFFVFNDYYSLCTSGGNCSFDYSDRRKSD